MERGKTFFKDASSVFSGVVENRSWYFRLLSEVCTRPFQRQGCLVAVWSTGFSLVCRTNE